MKKLYLIFCILIISIAAQAQQPKAYYVSIGGDDDNDGSKSTPWKTLAYAEKTATTPGDTIALKKGDVWLIDNVIDISHGGTDGNPITWDGGFWGTGANAIIQANSNGSSGPKYNSIVHIADCHDVTFQNITIDAHEYKRHGLIIGGDYRVQGPTRQNNEHDIIIQDCSILDCGHGETYRQALLVRPWYTDISNITIRRNFIDGASNNAISFYPYRSDLGSDGIPGHGISDSYIGYNTVTNWGRGSVGVDGILINMKITNTIIEHNILTTGNKSGAGGNGIHITSNEPIDGYFPTGIIVRYNDVRIDAMPALKIFSGQAVTVDIYGNLFYRRGGEYSGCVIVKNQGTRTYTGAAINIYNNTIIVEEDGSTNLAGFKSQSKVPGIGEFKNNIVYHNAGGNSGGIYIGSPTSFSHSNNLFYRSAIGNLQYAYDGEKIYYLSNAKEFESTAEFSDPLFASLAGVNLHLQDDISPAYKKGIFIPGFVTKDSVDMEGTQMNDPPSMGCFQALAGDHPPKYSSSVIDDASPDILEMIYDLYLDYSSVPETSAFDVLVNDTSRTVTSVNITGNKVRLTLSSEIEFEDIITVAYTKPAAGAIRSQAGLEAESLSAQEVTNNVHDPDPTDIPPVLVINYDSTSYSGFVSEIDASGSYDGNNDPLSFEWTAPDDVPVSSTNDSRIQFLAPMVDKTEKVVFFLEVTDGHSIQTKTIPVDIIPYRPDLDIATIINVDAVFYEDPNYPENIIDGDPETRWSVNGLDHLLNIKLEEPFKVSHLELSFLLGQQRNSYFDIKASKDSITWQPVLTNAFSCDFSGNTHVFDFPETESLIEYSYIQLVGQGNSQDLWNSFSEIRIFGTPQFNELNIAIYPNPAWDFINVRIEDPSNTPDDPIYASRLIRIMDITGMIVFEDFLDPGENRMHIRIDQIPLIPGVYIVQLVLDYLTMTSQKLVVIK